MRKGVWSPKKRGVGSDAGRGKYRAWQVKEYGQWSGMRGVVLAVSLGRGMQSGVEGGVEGGLKAVQGQLTAVGGVRAGGAAGVGAVRRSGVFGGVGVRLGERHRREREREIELRLKNIGQMFE
jgi:hypothetical protein